MEIAHTLKHLEIEATLPSFEHQKLANDISNKFGKDVKLKVSKSGKGKIEIPFNSNDDLHQIISQLAL